MEAVFVYPDDPEARKRVSENFTEVMFNIFAEDFKKGGPLMKKLNSLVEQEKDILQKFKDYNNEKIKEYKKETTEYAKGYIAALKEQTKILDKQLKVLSKVDYGI